MNAGGTTAAVEYAGTRTAPLGQLAARCRRHADLRRDGGGAVIFHFHRVRHPAEYYLSGESYGCKVKTLSGRGDQIG